MTSRASLPPVPRVAAHPALVHVLRARWRMARRGVAQLAFPLFVLGPVLLGGGALIGERYLFYLRSAAARWLAGHPDLGGPALALAVTLALWPGVVREVFGRGRDLLDVLPLAEPARFAATAVAAAARGLVPAAVLLATAAALAIDGVDVRWGAWALRALAACAYLGLLTLLLALVLVRLGWARAGRLVLLGAVLAAAVPLAASSATTSIAGRVVLAPWRPAAAGLEGLMAEALGLAPAAASTWTSHLAAVPVVLLAAVAHRRWRRSLLDDALELDLPRSRLRLWPGRPRRPVPALLRRDLRLVVRRFSAAVPVALGAALALDTGAALLSLVVPWPEPWRRRLLVAGGTLGVLAVCAVVPFLLAHQLPRLWLEKSSGVALDDVWRAKARLAGVLALAPALAGLALVLWLAPGEPLQRVAAAAQLVLCAAIVASMIGLSVFEIPDPPILGLVFAALVGLALAALIVFYPRAWWLWCVAWAWAASMLAGRAGRRVRFTEVSR